LRRVPAGAPDVAREAAASHRRAAEPRAGGRGGRDGRGVRSRLCAVPGVGLSQGAGRRAADIEAWLWDGGAGAILLETADDETSASAFYEKHGYMVLETIPRFYEDGTGALRMIKDAEM
jgi:hypothetical protein